MNKDERILTTLRNARALLDKTYIKWITWDYSGGHCALGALTRSGGATNEVYALNNAAVALYPQFLGAKGKRPAPYNRFSKVDKFNDHPIVYLNNHVGKEATLAVFDAAILDLELKLAPVVEPVVEEPALVEA